MQAFVPVLLASRPHAPNVFYTKCSLVGLRLSSLLTPRINSLASRKNLLTLCVELCFGRLVSEHSILVNSCVTSFSVLGRWHTLATTYLIKTSAQSAIHSADHQLDESHFALMFSWSMFGLAHRQRTLGHVTHELTKMLCSVTSRPKHSSTRNVNRLFRLAKLSMRSVTRLDGRNPTCSHFVLNTFGACGRLASSTRTKACMNANARCYRKASTKYTQLYKLLS